MRKSHLYTLAILGVIILVGLISISSNKTGDYLLYAYWPTPISGWTLNPNVVNDFETNHAAHPYDPLTDMPYPPVGMETDYYGWKGSYYDVLPYPTPAATVCSSAGCGTDSMVPFQVFGTGFLRMEWTGSSNSSIQYIHLTNYANAIPGAEGMNFENVGCGGLVTAPAMSGPLSTTAGDWGCYSYLRLFVYLNYGANNGTPLAVSQTVSLFDGSLSITSGTINLDCLGQSVCCNTFSDHLTVSLNYLANQYNAVTGRYFSVSNIADVIINAPQTDYTYSGLKSPSVPSAFSAARSHSLFVYYDHLVLGDYLAVPDYESPAGITVTTAFGTAANPITGAFIGWTHPSSAQVTPVVPITAFHIYRSLSNTAGVGPYVPVAIVRDVPANVTFFVDTQNFGGAVYCYKVLTCNNGPTSNASDEKLNTINATYSEPLLNATIVIEKCGYVAPRPSATSTFTNSPTYAGTSTFTITGTPPTLTCTVTLTGTITPTGTMTQTATPIQTKSLSNAHVYPNPFSPNKGSKLFHVGNVQLNTKIHIYAMDGSLVKDGVYSTGTEFTWNGRNKNGSLVVSGLYYLVLEDPQKKTEVFRVIVCYKCDPVYVKLTPTP